MTGAVRDGSDWVHPKKMQVSKYDGRFIHPQLERLLDFLFEAMKSGRHITRTEALAYAGYSSGVQRKNASKVFNAKRVKDIMEPVVKTMQAKRVLALKHITGAKLEAASAKDNAAVSTIMTKDIQLLTGKETERIGVSLSSLFDRASENG